MKIILLAAAFCFGSITAVDLDAAKVCDGGAILEKIRGFVPQWSDFCKTLDRTGLKITYTGNVVTLAVAEDSSESLTDFLPSTGVKFLDSEKRIDIESLVIDLNEPKSLSIKTRPYPSLEIVKEYLSVDSAVVALTVGKGSDGRVTISDLEAGGIWGVGSARIEVGIKKKGGVYSFSGAPVGGDISIGDFAKALGERLLPKSAEAALNKAGLGKFVLKNVAVKGHYDSDKDNLAFCLTGSPTISGWGGFRLHVLFHRYSGGANTAVTIGITFGSTRLSDLIQKVSGISVSNVPVLKDVVVPNMGLLVSTANVDPNLLPDCVDGILKDTAPFPEGLSVVLKFKITSDAPESKYLIRIEPNLGVTVEPLENAVKLSDVVRAININLNSLQLPAGLRNILDVNVQSFNYDKTSGVLTTTLSWGDELVLVPNIVKIRQPYLNLNVSTRSPRSIQFDAHGQWALGPTTFEVDIMPQDDGKGYILMGSGSLLNFGDVGASILPSGLVVDFLRNFEIVNPSVFIPLGEVAQTQMMMLSGQPRIAGFNGPQCYILTKRVSGALKGAVGFDFANTEFAGILKKFTGKSIAGVKMFDQGLKLGVIVASADFPGESFDGPTLGQLGEIKKGLTLAGVFNLPPCGNDPICKFLKPVLGGSSLQLKATIANVNSFSVTAGLTNIRLGSGMTIESAGLELVISTTSAPSVGIVCALRLHNPALLFEGAFRAMPTGELQANMKMSGIWQRAFGLNFLSFGNLLFSIKFVPGVSPTAFEIGGEVHIGTNAKLKGAAYLGIDTTDPKQNYFYVSINSVTIYDVMTTFGIRVALPRPLRESGFVGGLEVSYATFEKRVPGRTIPAGFKLKGLLNIIGFRLRADIHVAWQKFIKVDFEMSPLSLAGGMFKMYAHPNQKSRGPYLKALISRSPLKVSIDASGYVELFGFMKTGATLKILEREYIMEVRRPFFAIFQAYLRVHASFGSLSRASFGVYGELDASWLSDLKNKVVNLIKQGADAATAKIRAAERKVNDAKAPFDRAQSKLRSAQDKVNRLCRIKSCSSLCIGCPTWRKCGWARCPGWNSCCRRITNPICAAANLACKALRGTAYAALWVAEKAVGVAKAPLHAANAILATVRRGVALAARAATWIVSNALTSLINIRKISFDVNIGVVSGGNFGGAIEVSFLKRPFQRIGFTLRFKSIWGMVKDLADRAFPGITGRRRRDVETSLKAAFPDYALKDPYRPGLYRPKRDDFDFRDLEKELEEAKQPPSISAAVLPSTALPSLATIKDEDDEEERAESEKVINALHDIAEKAKHTLDETPREEDDKYDDDDDNDVPTTNEGRCELFNKRSEQLTEVFTAVVDAASSVLQEVREWTTQEEKLRECRSTVKSAEEEGSDLEKEVQNITEEYRQLGSRAKREIRDVEERVKMAVDRKNDDLLKSAQICDEMQQVQQEIRNVFVESNARGLRLIFEDLDTYTQKKYNQPFDRFLHDRCEQVAAVYQHYDGEKSAEARKVFEDLQHVCNRFTYGEDGENIADLTLAKAKNAAKAALELLKDAKSLSVFCA